jgi:hypothetical protein
MQFRCGQFFQDQHRLIGDNIPIAPDDLEHPPVHVHQFYFDLLRACGHWHQMYQVARNGHHLKLRRRSHRRQIDAYVGARHRLFCQHYGRQGKPGRLFPFGFCELKIYPAVGHLLSRNLNIQSNDFDPDPADVADAHQREVEFLESLGYLSR